ncbi:MAG TPA: MBL fold metallo-hydrolase [Candidatus Aminicenantes bacterium]|nr:MBL fold metallo-hydrolase [Candidatus Aminicenantes bacterium]HRY65122.1 MBL fold metallo-hydrolase [Candidatus Aminicenantes bacterium]HRZ72410.1 MBL fold metallo-hydrolase [Candidatus Aminicenantes bacterium]
MRLIIILGALALGLAGGAAIAPSKFETDVIPTSAGPLEITFLGHGSLLLAFGGKTVQVDPFGEVADYGALPKADLVLVTHEHMDHLDPAALKAILKPGTFIIGSRACAAKLPGAAILANGERTTVLGLPIEAVPAYNIVHLRPGDGPFHPRGQGNGYVIAFGDKKVYIAGDTENIPEMKALKGIDAAFLPMNLPYTMSPEQVADAARAFRPGILYPYHFGDTDTSRLVKLLQGEKGIEIRIRRMQ